MIERLNLTMKCDEHAVSSAQDDTSTYVCPKCGRPMRKRRGMYGVFWGCTGYHDKENPCTHKMSDKDGVPITRQATLTNFTCGACGGQLVLRKGEKNGRSFSFFGCSNYPNCKQTYQDDNGKPLFKTDVESHTNETQFACKVCGSKLIHRQGYKPKGRFRGIRYSFFACSNSKNCIQTYPEKNGMPRYE